MTPAQHDQNSDRSPRPEETSVNTVDHDAFSDLPALLTIPRTALLLGISRASAYRYAAAGELPTHRLGGRVFVVTAKLRATIAGGEAA